MPGKFRGKAGDGYTPSEPHGEGGIVGDFFEGK